MALSTLGVKTAECCNHADPNRNVNTRLGASIQFPLAGNFLLLQSRYIMRGAACGFYGEN